MCVFTTLSARLLDLVVMLNTMCQMSSYRCCKTTQALSGQFAASIVEESQERPTKKRKRFHASQTSPRRSSRLQTKAVTVDYRDYEDDDNMDEVPLPRLSLLLPSVVCHTAARSRMSVFMFPTVLSHQLLRQVTSHDSASNEEDEYDELQSDSDDSAERGRRIL